MIEQSKAVQRWTGLVEAHEGGGFVAVGDYMALVEEIERMKAELTTATQNKDAMYDAAYKQWGNHD